MGRLFTTESLANFLQVSERTVKRYKEEYKMPCVIIRGSIRYREKEITTWLKREKVNGR